MEEFLPVCRAGRIPLITAHAGCMGTVPNSIESISAAFASSADIVEVDIRATSDGIPILLHDESLQSADSTRIPVNALSWSSLLDADPEILSLERFFSMACELDERLHPDQRTCINLDIKDISALLQVKSVVHAYQMEDKVLFSGLEREDFPYAAACLTGMYYFLNVQNRQDSRACDASMIDEVCSFAFRHGCLGINLEWVYASPAIIEEIHAQGLFASLWTVDKVVEMESALECEADSITTNYPDQLAALIDARREKEARL